MKIKAYIFLSTMMLTALFLNIDIFSANQRKVKLSVPKGKEIKVTITSKKRGHQLTICHGDVCQRFEVSGKKEMKFKPTSGKLEIEIQKRVKGYWQYRKLKVNKIKNNHFLVSSKYCKIQVTWN